jgi:xylan 1,4-beta-xylosidase
VTLILDRLPARRYRVRHHRVDLDHSNIVRTWADLGGPDWPDEQGWERLRAADRLEELEPPRVVETSGDGRVDLGIRLPMPAISLVELFPADRDDG